MTRPGDMEIDLTDDAMNEGGPSWSAQSAGVSLPAAIEALLLIAEEPVAVTDLAAFLDQPPGLIEEILRRLAAEYDRDARGFDLREVDGGWRYYTARRAAPVVAAKASDRHGARLSRAALETLAVVAYRQPISRSRIAAIRGVNVDGVIRTLLSRGLVTEMATDPETGAALFGTTGYFLERMGLGSLTELPPVADHLPDSSTLDDFADPMR